MKDYRLRGMCGPGGLEKAAEHILNHYGAAKLANLDMSRVDIRLVIEALIKDEAAMRERDRYCTALMFYSDAVAYGREADRWARLAAALSCPGAFEAARQRAQAEMANEAWVADEDKTA